MKSHASPYQEHRPADALNAYVACYWTYAAPPPPPGGEVRVLPDGCIDIIFDLSHCDRSAGRTVGTMTRPLILQNVGAAQLAAVRFRPGGAVPFLRLAAHEITDGECSLPNDWHADSIAQRLRECAAASERARLLERALLLRLPAARPVEHRVQEAVSLIARQSVRIDAVAKKVGVSRQHLNRLFRQHVGVGPKVYARVDRLQKLADQVKRLGSRNWSTCALDTGYFDQAHMIAECRALTGLTPTALCQG